MLEAAAASKDHRPSPVEDVLRGTLEDWRKSLRENK
jgi:hypothetical protein